METMSESLGKYVEQRRAEWATYVEHWKESADHQARLVLDKIDAAARVYPTVEAADAINLFAEARAIHFGIVPTYQPGEVDQARLELYGRGSTTQIMLERLRGRLVLEKDKTARVLVIYF